MLRLNHRPLGGSLALIELGLASGDGGSEDYDLRLRLPPIGRGGTLPSPAALRAIAALYLQSEMEQAGVILLAEHLAETKGGIPYLSVRAAEKLEDFSRRQRDWYDRRQRELIFARVLGSGRAASEGAGSAASNRAFQTLLASLCLALVGYAEDQRWGQQPGAAREATLRMAALDLLGNLGPHQYGNTQPAARLIHDQLQRAIDILDDPAIGAVFQRRGIWDTLRKAFGAAVPDLGRLVTRGQSGMRLINWLADVVTQLAGSTRKPLTAPDAPVITWAASWLQASGLSLRAAA
jgi:hypothetical protein